MVIHSVVSKGFDAEALHLGQAAAPAPKVCAIADFTFGSGALAMTASTVFIST
jgi:hypothetical protein